MTTRIKHTDKSESIAANQQTAVYALLRGFIRLDGTRVTAEQASDMAFAVYQIARNHSTSSGA